VVCLHFEGTYDWDARDPQPDTEPVLVAVRYGGDAFADTFTFTRPVVRTAAFVGCSRLPRRVGPSAVW
jgi:hypothetical protein